MPEPDPERFGPPAGGTSISRRSSPPGSAFSSDSNISVASSVGVSRAASSPEDSSTKRSMEKAKESAVLGSPQPTPLASPIRAENRVKCSWELFHPHLASLSPDLKSVTALRDLTCCAALGRPPEAATRTLQMGDTGLQHTVKSVAVATRRTCERHFSKYIRRPVPSASLPAPQLMQGKSSSKNRRCAGPRAN